MAQPEKEMCFIPLIGFKCPPECPGLVAARFILNEPYEYFVQVCPNPSTLGGANSEADYCGNGPDVITMHRDTVPTDEEYLEAAKNFGW